eukprot:m.113835 g.113835  ORF g.113835 m.113835 type:complete len:155 (+) comp37465_c0_seq12:590-1054(+)
MSGLLEKEEDTSWSFAGKLHSVTDEHATSISGIVSRGKISVYSTSGPKPSPFTGRLANCMQTPNGKTLPVMFESFNSISLSIVGNFNTLDDCLKEFTKKEIVDCSEDESLTREKRFCFARVGRILYVRYLDICLFHCQVDASVLVFPCKKNYLD